MCLHFNIKSSDSGKKELLNLKKQECLAPSELRELRTNKKASSYRKLFKMLNLGAIPQQPCPNIVSCSFVVKREV